MPSSLKLFNTASHVSGELWPSQSHWEVCVMPGQLEDEHGLDPWGHQPEGSHTRERLDLHRSPMNEKQQSTGLSHRDFKVCFMLQHS